MGEHNVEKEVDERKSQAFMKALLEDLRALAFMLEDGRVESGVRRIGAEQEMFLIDRDFRPAPLSVEVLKAANDARLTTEIARFTWKPILRRSLYLEAVSVKWNKSFRT